MGPGVGGGGVSLPPCAYVFQLQPYRALKTQQQRKKSTFKKIHWISVGATTLMSVDQRAKLVFSPLGPYAQL